MFNQPLLLIRSRDARQKFLRKNITKPNRDEAKDRAIGVILEVYNNESNFGRAQSVCDEVINDIAQRVAAGQPEPDVDGFEVVANPELSNSLIPYNNDGSSPAASPIRTPGHVPLPPSPLSGSDDSL